ncbi:MAG: branched-chain amino acid ABC transporter permease, partial [Proteobacteria bacterium]|nr:branched-chain amino acid ABC transporter permease [Pseudomonadota bacterium]
MSGTNGSSPGKLKTFKNKLRESFAQAPLLGWLLGALAAVVLEYYLGDPLADLLGLPKIPVLFGFVIMLKKPLLIPSAVIYVTLIYVIPIAALARLTSALTNRLAAKLMNLSMLLSVVIHLGLLYITLHVWSDMSAYRVLTLKLTLIAVMVTLSLNLVNGYMGEFSCSHPGFMALGAYATSVFTVSLFVNDKLFGTAILPSALGP